MNIRIVYPSHREYSLMLLGVLAVISLGCSDGDTPSPSAEKLLVAWTSDAGTGSLRAMTTRQPWRFEGVALAIGADAAMRCAGGELYVLSRHDGSLSVVELEPPQMRMIAALGAGEPVDVAVIDAATAYLTLRSETHLLKLDIPTGAITEVVDLSVYADDDGTPDLGMMTVYEGRLFVQILRASAGTPFGFVSPPYIAVVDLETQTLVDADPNVDGVQAIALQGTAPKHRMQVIANTRELFVSASGAYFDEGGIEVIDLDTLKSKGLIVRESDGEVGADLGPFIMVTPDVGYLIFSTDLDLSSHLRRFSRDGGVDPPPDLNVAVGYAVPALAYDAAAELLFLPEGEDDSRGIRVFDGDTGIQLTPVPIATTGRPSDLVLDCTR